MLSDNTAERLLSGHCGGGHLEHLGLSNGPKIWMCFLVFVLVLDLNIGDHWRLLILMGHGHGPKIPKTPRQCGSSELLRYK